jgi:hypothetical protein
VSIPTTSSFEVPGDYHERVWIMNEQLLREQPDLERLSAHSLQREIITLTQVSNILFYCGVRSVIRSSMFGSAPPEIIM